MVFSSHLFLFYFLPLVLLLNYTVPFRLLSLVLTLMSYAFYGWMNPVWVLLMLFSSYVDYFCGLALVYFGGLPLNQHDLPYLPKHHARSFGQKLTLAVSMISNLGIIAFFKYYHFAASNIDAIAKSLGWSTGTANTLHFALPIGLSFYTFQSMSYAIDVYRGDARPLKNPIDFQLFVALFPHQIAGPIIRYQTVAEQIRYRSFTYEKFARGASLFCLGMSKKVLLANPMGHIADASFAAATMRWNDAWYGVFSYAFQIYFDFSAYSEMAVGLGLMLGFYFMKNFDDPYQSRSITEFWQRWHISLSTWLRDYLYLPLGGSRRGAGRTYINLMMVMLLGGLWHGASWNFVLWGGLHGGMLACERRFGNLGLRIPSGIRSIGTFLLVCLGWVLFRADTFDQAGRYFRSLFGLEVITPSADALAATIYTPYHLLVFAVAAIATWLLPQAWTFTQRLTPVRAVACLLFGVSVTLLWTQTVNPFLYFQF